MLNPKSKLLAAVVALFCARLAPAQGSNALMPKGFFIRTDGVRSQLQVNF